MDDVTIANAKWRVEMKRSLRLCGITSEQMATLDTFQLEMLYGKVCLSKEVSNGEATNGLALCVQTM